jgi:hypothetical protein
MRNKHFDADYLMASFRTTPTKISQNRSGDCVIMFPLKPANRYSRVAPLPACADYRFFDPSYG